MSDPASIRYNNPGAMWGKNNSVATKFGADPKNTVGLNDGLNQGNNIAVFPDKVHGAAAQFALWARGYTGLTLLAATTKWSGGNSSTAYMTFLTSKTGLTPSSLITLSVLTSPTGLKLMKAQAQWEAGKPYPLSDAEWLQAQKLAFPNADLPAAPATPVVVSKPSPVSIPTPTPVTPPAPSPSILGGIWNWLRKH